MGGRNRRAPLLEMMPSSMCAVQHLVPGVTESQSPNEQADKAHPQNGEAQDAEEQTGAEEAHSAQKSGGAEGVGQALQDVQPGSRPACHIFM